MCSSKVSNHWSARAAHSDLESGKFSTRLVTTYFNVNKPDKEHWKAPSIGRVVKRLGFKPKRMSGGKAGWVYDAKLVEKLLEQCSVVNGEMKDTPPTNLHHIHFLHFFHPFLRRHIMIEVEIFENKTYFRDGIRIVGPLDHESLFVSIIEVASELNVKPVLILCLYIGNRNQVTAQDNEEALIHSISGDGFPMFNQTN